MTQKLWMLSLVLSSIPLVGFYTGNLKFIIWSKLSTMFLKITFSPKKLQPLC